MNGVFVSSTGTGSGKTYVSRGLAAALRARGERVVALKPVETGVDPDALDAIALARAAGDPALAHARGFYRARAPLSPLAAGMSGEPLPPTPTELAAAVREAAGSARAIVEGAGGLFVPLDHAYDIADLVLALGVRALVVAPDRLGVLSDVLALAGAARLRGVPLLGVVLVDLAPRADMSRASNHAILAERLAPLSVLRFPECADDDDALAEATVSSGVLDLVLGRPRG